MQNRWLNALFKTFLVLIVAHVLLLILGLFWGGVQSMLGLPVFWAHWSGGIGSSFLAVILLVLLYFVIYAFFTNSYDKD